MLKMQMLASCGHFSTQEKMRTQQFLKTHTMLILSSIFLCVFAKHSDAGDQEASTRPTVESTFLTEAPKAWAITSEFICNSEGKLTRRFEHPGNANPTTNTNGEYHLDINHGYFLFSTADASTPSLFSTVTCANPKYSFELRRSGKSTNYSILNCVKSGSDVAMNYRMKNRRTVAILQFLLADEYFCGEKMEAVIAVAHIISSESVKKNQQVQVNFEIPDPDPSSKKVFPGWVVLDIQNHWAITSYQRIFSDGSKTTADIEYQHEVAKIAFPRKVVQKDFDASGKVTDILTTNFEQPKHYEYKAEDFQLSAFGLEEPGN